MPEFLIRSLDLHRWDQIHAQNKNSKKCLENMDSNEKVY